MRRTITQAVLALVLAVPAIAAAGPSRWDGEERPVITERMDGPDTFTCNTGGGDSLLVAAAVVGMVLCHRRTLKD